MKKRLSIMILATLTLSLASCQKESTEPSSKETSRVSVCNQYEIQLVMDNAPTTFNIFKNNVAMPATFQACVGDLISVAMTQPFQQDQQDYGQCNVQLLKSGQVIQSVSGNGQAIAFTYTVQ